MVQIVGCGRTVAGQVVAFDIKWEGDLTAHHAVLWGVEVSQGEECVLLGHGRIEGDFAEQFVEDTGTGRRQKLDDDADLGEDEVTARFPADVVGVAADWPLWTAIIRADGQEIAREVIPTG
jgi:hypothetical protein